MSQMYVIDPYKFSLSMLASTTAVEIYPEWTAGTYSEGDRVLHDPPSGASSGKRVYECVVASTTGVPGVSADWLDIGPCNKCAMFDNKISTQTTGDSTLVVEITPGDITSNLGLLNLIGSEVLIEVIVDSTVVHSESRGLNEAEISDWWGYYFEPDSQVSRALFDDLPLFYSPTIRITLTGPGDVAIGHCIFGTRQDLGILELGANAELIDYSRKITDDFGDTVFVQRDFADEFSGQMYLDNEQLNSFKRITRKLRATPTLYVGSSDPQYAESLIAFGWLRRSSVSIAYPKFSLIDFEVGALT